MSGKNLVLEKKGKREKVGRAVGIIGSKMNVFQYILNLVHQILMKLGGNVLGMKRMKANEYGHMCRILARAWPSFRPKLGHIWSQIYRFQYIS